MDQNDIQLAHTIWSAALTAFFGGFGTLVWWNWKQLNKRLDAKAEADEVNAHSATEQANVVRLQGLIDAKAEKTDLERRHLEQQTALARLEATIANSTLEATESRAKIYEQLTTLIAKLSSLEGWVAGRENRQRI